MASKDLFTSY